MTCPKCGGTGQLRNWSDHSEKRRCPQCFGSGRHVTDSPERFAIYRLCDCTTCHGSGKDTGWVDSSGTLARCEDCRGEGRTRDLVATCATPEAVGVALVTLGREGEWAECPVGILDTEGEPGEKWILTPWLPSAPNTSQAGRVLRSAKTKLGTESEARSLLPRRKGKT